MKRAPWYVVTGAVAGFAAVLGLHGLAGTPAALSQPASPSGPGGANGSGGNGTGANGGAGGSGGGSGGGPAASPSPRSGGTTARVRTATGSVVNYGYGQLAVTVTVKGKQITGLSLATLRTVDPFSQQLAEQDIPVLKSEVLRAHGARVNAVSGATYTSQAYLDSLQSALDKLNVG